MLRRIFCLFGRHHWHWRPDCSSLMYWKECPRCGESRIAWDSADSRNKYPYRDEPVKAPKYNSTKALEDAGQVVTPKAKLVLDKLDRLIFKADERRLKGKS